MRALVATSTLAWGVNMPARRVVVTGVTRGLSGQVSPIDIKQMVGRAGRAGLDERGDAYVLLPAEDFDGWRKQYETIPPIQSHLSDEDVLLFHVITELETGAIRNPESLMRWHERTLSAFQGNALTLEKAQAVFAMLEKCRAIARDGENSWHVTALGRISSWLYFDPRNVFHWAMGFKRIDDKGWWDRDAALADVLGAVPIGTLDYVSRDVEEDVKEYFIARQMLDPTAEPYVKGATAAAGYWYALTQDKVDGSMGVYVRSARADVERVVGALKLIDGMWGRWNRKTWWDALATRVRYGIGPELIPLVAIPGVGGARAKRIWDHGFKGLADVADAAQNGARRRLLSLAVGGLKVADKISAAAAAALRGEDVAADEGGDEGEEAN